MTSDLKACRPATVSLCHHERKTEIELKNQIGGKRIIICQFSIGNNILKVLNLTLRNKSSFSMQCPHPQASTAIFHRNLMYAFFYTCYKTLRTKITYAAVTFNTISIKWKLIYVWCTKTTVLGRKFNLKKKTGTRQKTAAVGL